MEYKTATSLNYALLKVILLSSAPFIFMAMNWAYQINLKSQSLKILPRLSYASYKRGLNLLKRSDTFYLVFCKTAP